MNLNLSYLQVHGAVRGTGMDALDNGTRRAVTRTETNEVRSRASFPSTSLPTIAGKERRKTPHARASVGAHADAVNPGAVTKIPGSGKELRLLKWREAFPASSPERWWRVYRAYVAWLGCLDSGSRNTP